MLNSQDRFDKQLLRLGDELLDLCRRRYIRVPLNQAIQRGWRRIHVIAPRAERRADKAVLVELLKLVGTVQFRNSPDFRHKRGRGRRRKFMEIEQPLRKLRVGEWDRLRFPGEWNQYFRREKLYCHRAWLDVLTFAQPYVFELKVEPNWVTETYIHDPVVEQRITEIESWLWHRNAKYRLERLWDSSNRWKDTRREVLLQRIVDCELREMMLGPLEVDPAPAMYRNRISLLVTFSPA